jgi:CrcB protein
MPIWTGYLLVFLGAGLGGTARHAINLGAQRLSGIAPVIGTFGINVAGALLLGVLAAHFAGAMPQREPLRLLLATGVLGGFTTFSTFSLDAANLWQRGQVAAATTYVLASVVLSLAAVSLGLGIGRRLLE